MLIDPKVNHLHQEAISRAKHARDVLKKAKIESKDYLATFDLLVATTANVGSDYNVPRVPLTPEAMAKEVSGANGKIALVFGPEGNGLTNEEIQQCHVSVTIPTDAGYKALNVSHAVAIVLYELSKHQQQAGQDPFPIASAKEKAVLLGMIDASIEQMQQSKQKKDVQKLVWRKVLGKSFLTKREAFALLGYFRRNGGR